MLPETIDRVPLFSLEAEASVLAAVLLEANAWERLIEAIPDPEMFYQPAHREIYRALESLREAGQPFGAVQLTDTLRTMQALERAGGVGYLAQLWDYVQDASNLDADARIVREKHQLRRLQSVGRDVAALAESGKSAEDVQEEAERLVFAASESVRTDAPLEHVKVGLLDTLEALERNEPDVLTGFAEFDRMSQGMGRGDLVILAARPSMGKTAFGLQVAVNVAVREHKPVPIFSLEMSKEAIARRMLFTEARVDIARFRQGIRTRDDEDRLRQALNLLAGTPIYTHCTARTVRQVRAQCRRLVAQHGPLAAIVIDYLGKMRGSGTTENRTHEIGEITGDLKALAVEFGIPVLLLSQLSRAVEARPDKRPMLSDLRDSGEIEQDADTVLMLYRPEYYFGATRKVGRGKAEEVESLEGKAELIVAKQRNGATGTVHLRFFKEFTRFESLSGREEW